MTFQVDVASVSRAKRSIILTNGESVHLAKLYDLDGDETEDADFAVSALGKLACGRWVIVDLDSFDN